MIIRDSMLALALLLGAAPLAAGQAATKTEARSAEQAEPLRFIVAPTGNEARYRVREQLVSFDLPNDAVGVSHDISGQVFVTPDGSVIPDSSRIIVHVTNLTSDQKRRDGYIKRRTIETDKYPTVELTPKSFVGLTAKPGASPIAFDVLGDLTVHGVTRPTIWKATAHAEGADIVGTATTAFTFKDFSLEQPKVPVLLSVEDTIKLEYDFRFTHAPAQISK